MEVIRIQIGQYKMPHGKAKKRYYLFRDILKQTKNNLNIDHLRIHKEDGISLTGSSIIKIILRILFEGFLNSILSVSGLKSERGALFH